MALNLVNSTNQALSQNFADTLLAWHAIHGRHHLPWKTGNPYHIWLSEIMLQQTQVKTVAPYFLRFIEAFPNIESLANAPMEHLLQHWQGLGYYRRAFYLKEAACHWHKYGQPKGLQAWQQLKGVGPSTGAALASFIDQEQVSIMDGNVERLLSRLFGIEHIHTQPSKRKHLLSVAQSIVPNAQKMPNYTQALMDFGSMVCSKKPACLTLQTPQNTSVCVFSTHCYAYLNHKIAELPSPKPKLIKQNVAQFYFWLNCTQQQKAYYILFKNNALGIWPNLYQPLCLEFSLDEANSLNAIHSLDLETLNQLKIQLDNRLKIQASKHTPYNVLDLFAQNALLNAKQLEHLQSMLAKTFLINFDFKQLKQLSFIGYQKHGLTHKNLYTYHLQLPIDLTMAKQIINQQSNACMVNTQAFCDALNTKPALPKLIEQVLLTLKVLS